MESDLDLLGALCDRDMTLRRLIEKRQRAERTIPEARALIEQRRATLRTLEERQSSLKTREHELNRKLHDYRKQIQSADHALEHGLGDADSAVRQRTRCMEIVDTTETELLELLEQFDELETTRSEARADLDSAKEALERASTRVPEELDALSSRVDELRSEREHLHAQLSPELARRYTLLLERKPPPVVRLREGACPRCQVVAPPQMLVDIRKGQLVTCRRCQRWLMLES